MKFKHVFLFVAAATLAGCASAPTPQTPGQFRADASTGAHGTEHDTYRVRGSYRIVAARIRRKAAECFNRTLTSEVCYVGGHCRDINYRINSHFRRGRTGSELVVQIQSTDFINLGGKPPKGGNFAAVADITPVRRGTRVAMYGLSAAWLKYIPRAVKHWADDSNLGCPDFSAARM